MGLTPSCCREPKVTVLKTSVKASPPSSSTLLPCCKNEEPTTFVPFVKMHEDAASNGPSCDGEAVSSSCVGTLSQGIDRNKSLETEQIEGTHLAVTASAASLSTYTSTEGYPHSTWDLGPPTTDDEQSRLQAFRALDILNSLSHGRGNRIDEEADLVLSALMSVFDAMTAMLVLFDDSRIIIRNSKGVMQPGEFPYRWSFCAYTLTKHRPQTLVVLDATKDMRFVDDPNVRFYCGAPLVSASGHIIGTICVGDNRPRNNFDVSKCYLINNMAELCVRQMERYHANAGPAGPIDPETTALARVARTIECYEEVIGLVDITLPNGWMLMYVNEAWEALCTPWTRKQLVGRTVQSLLLLDDIEKGDQPGGDPATAVAAADIVGKTQRSSMREEEEPARSERAGAEDGNISVSTSGACVICRDVSASSSYDRSGNVLNGESEDSLLQARRLASCRQPNLIAVSLAEQRQERRQVPLSSWRRHEGALRAGAEVNLGQARVLMEDGLLSSTVVRVTARSANCHVLDAAVRMPVGVPHHLGLPTSILAAGSDDRPLVTLFGDGSTGGDILEQVCKANKGGACSQQQEFPEEADVRPEPHYCMLILTKDGEDAGANDEEEVLTEQRATKHTFRGGADGNCSGGGGDSQAPLVPLTLPASDLASPWMTRPSSQVLGASAHRGQPLIGDGSSCYSTSSGGRCAQGSVGTRASTRGIRTASISSDCWTYGMEPFPGLKLGHLLGKGGYGKVFLAKFKNQTVAAKVVSNAMLKSTTCVNGVTLEALLAQEVEHTYIVRTYKCVVRSCRSWDQPSLKGSRTGNGVRCNMEHGLPSERGGGDVGDAPNRISVLSVMPGHPSDYVTPANSELIMQQSNPNQVVVHAAERFKAATSTANAPKAGSSWPAANRAWNDVCSADAATAGVVPQAAAGAKESSVPIATVVAPQQAPDDLDFDSFDVNGNEGMGGMIDQLVSGGQPSLVPYSGASHPIHPPSANHMQPVLPYVATADGMSVAGSGSVSQSAHNEPRGGALLSTKTDVNIDQVVTGAAAQHGAPPHGPNDGICPAELSNLSAGCSVSKTAASTTMVNTAIPSIVRCPGGGTDASWRCNSRASQDSMPEGETWIIQEYCGRGTLQDAVETGKLRTVPSRLYGKPHMPYILLTAQEIASAMNCLHSRGYMHGDLSAVNILLTDAPVGSQEGGFSRGWIAKVSDFGMAKHLPDPNKPYVSSAYGVITHCAPEVLKSHEQTQKADCYSFGVLLWQMFTGSRPWANMNRFQILGAVTSPTPQGLRFLPTHQPPEWYHDLTMRCLSRDPVARPTFAEICEELRLVTYQTASAGLMRAA